MTDPAVTPQDGFGSILQRLFSTFPNSWPGFGLLLLRIGLSIALVYYGAARRPEAPWGSGLIIQNSISALASFFLLAGLWTPAIGVLTAFNEILIALMLDSSHHDDRWVHVFLATEAISVAMLGPGAWSIDARLFGRKRVDIDRSRG